MWLYAVRKGAQYIKEETGRGRDQRLRRTPPHQMAQGGGFSTFLGASGAEFANGPLLFEPARGLVGFEGIAGYSQRGSRAGRAVKKGVERGQAATVTRTCNLRGGAALAYP